LNGSSLSLGAESLHRIGCLDSDRPVTVIHGQHVIPGWHNTNLVRLRPSTEEPDAGMCQHAGPKSKPKHGSVPVKRVVPGR
jgi:hypothetical protein